MTYIVVEYTNENIKQPLKIIYKNDYVLKAKK